MAFLSGGMLCVCQNPEHLRDRKLDLLLGMGKGKYFIQSLHKCMMTDVVEFSKSCSHDQWRILEIVIQNSSFSKL